MSCLEIHQLESIRGDSLLFEQLSFRVETGELLQIDGENGSGKSTLLRMIAGLTQPTEGQINWNQQSINVERQQYNQSMSYIGHSNGIKESLTNAENLSLIHALSGRTDHIDHDTILMRVGLSGMNKVLSGKMSAGQKRRLSLSRLLIKKSSLWLLDEPFTSLDADGKQIIESMIDEQCRTSGIVIFATHQPVEIQGHAVRRVHLGQHQHA
ncbi:MAG: cytochrome c biogenesis heme-transporting ATPase CcmA [Pseudomonadota bacterium]